MATFESILVPIQFAEACANAVNRARLLAAEHGARVTLLHVVNPADLGGARRKRNSATAVDQTAAQAQLALRRYAARFTDIDDAHVAQVVCVGDPVEEVAAAAQRADLLIVGAKKTNALRDVLFGAPTERFLRLARRPVLLTRKPPWNRYRTLLVPMQLTAYSEAVAYVAARLAPMASLHLQHALPGHREPVVRTAERSALSIWLHHDRVRRKAALRMESLAASFKASDLAVRSDYGDLAQLALRERDRIEADLIVACKDDQASDVDFLLGDTAQRMLADCRCDTLLIPRAWIAQGAKLAVLPRFEAAAAVGRPG